MASPERLEGDQVHFDRRGEIAILTVDNPPVNTIGHRVRLGLAAGLARVASDPTLRAAVISCEGRTWLSGADVTEFGGPRPEPTIQQIAASLDALEKPVVAALFGTVFGGGFELALACAARVADPKTRLGLPEVSLGIVPGCGGTQRLPRLIGVEAAFEIILTARSFSAEQGRETGAVDLLSETVVDDAVALAEALVQEMRRPRVRDLDVPPPPEGFIEAASRRVQRTHRGHYAASRLVDCFEALLTLPFDQALAVEHQAIADCLANPQSAALRHVFFAERSAAKLGGGAAEPRPVRQIAVLGAGTMGSGIAIAAADAGYEVSLFDADPGALDRGVQRIAQTYAGLVKKGRLEPGTAAERQARIRMEGAVDSLSGANLYIEAVFEDLAVKTDVLARLDAVAREGAVLATNTSYLSIDTLADATRRPGDVVGIHFFSPAHVMRLCEIVRGPRTSSETLATALAVARRMGKVAVVSADADGFIGNFMLKAYRREAMLLALQGNAIPEIDQALVDWGFAMGPFQVADLAGLDIGYRNRRRLPEAERDPVEGWVPDRLVEAGRLGRKSQRGYYDYGAGRPQFPDTTATLVAEAAEALSVPRLVQTPDEIVRRCLDALRTAGEDLLERGVASRASDIDLVYVHGYGFPAYRGGPMYWTTQLSARD
jgi:3-hydroxyacyl-CoA dehydrogenase